MTVSLMFSFTLVLILVICILLLLLHERKLKQHYEALRESFDNLEKLNGKLRIQRHDYLNHLQVVYGLLELQEYEELYRYLTPVYKDMQKTGKALKTSMPAVNALLKAKMDEAENRGIDFYVEVKSDLKMLKAEAWELCKVLANLLDNAMTALENQTGERRIELDITETPETFCFDVMNNGPMIPEAMQKTIFKQGITTKKGEGHGMGLAIVMDVLKSYGGVMKLYSQEERTIFSFSIPKEKRKGETVQQL